MKFHDYILNGCVGCRDKGDETGWKVDQTILQGREGHLDLDCFRHFDDEVGVIDEALVIIEFVSLFQTVIYVSVANNIWSSRSDHESLSNSRSCMFRA